MQRQQQVARTKRERDRERERGEATIEAGRETRSEFCLSRLSSALRTSAREGREERRREGGRAGQLPIDTLQ